MMSRFIAILALTTAAAVAAVHVLAIFGYTPIGLASLMPVSLLAFAAVGAVVADAMRRRATAVGNAFAFVQQWPAWARYLYQAIGAYALITFVWFLLWSRAGTLEYQGSQAYLSRHGVFIRTLDAGGVRAFHAWEVRLFTSYTLLFLIIPGLYCLLRPRRDFTGTTPPRAP